MSKNEAGTIASRFTSDRLSIQRQLDFQKRQASIFVTEIEKHNEVLLRFGLKELPTRDALGLPPYALFDDEIKNLIPHVDALLPRLEKLESDLIDMVSTLAEEIHNNGILGFGAEEDFSLARLDEWTGKLQSHYGAKDLIEQSRENLVNHLLKDELSSDDGRSIPLGVIDYVVDEARQRAMNDIAASAFELRERFEEFKIIAESGQPSAPLGLMRQSYIALMASFDAAIVDLVRLALKKDFFPLMTKVERKLAIDCAELESWEELRESLIDSQLRKHYAVGWVHILNGKWSVLGLNPEQDFELPRVTEQFNRRNVILHNRGVVDEKYVSKFNLDGLSVGQVAVVSDSYLHRASELNERMIHHMARWVASL